MLKTGVLVMLLSTSLFANWFTNLFDPTPTPTIKIPVDLTKAGTIVDMEFRVDYDEATCFALDFYFIPDKVDNDTDYKKIKKFLGMNGYLYASDKKITVADYARAKRELGNMVDENYDLDGTRVPLKITLKKVEDNGELSTVLEKIYSTRGANDGTVSSLNREFLIKHFKQGKYKIKVESLSGFSELKNRKIEFRIRSNKIK